MNSFGFWSTGVDGSGLQVVQGVGAVIGAGAEGNGEDRESGEKFCLHLWFHNLNRCVDFRFNAKLIQRNKLF